MSVTFWIPQAPTMRVQPYPDEPDFWIQEPVPPFTEINVSNSNAVALLSVLDPTRGYGELCGTWGREDLIRVRKNLLEAVNSTRVREQLVSPSFSEVGDGGCTLYICGRDEDYVAERLEQLAQLVKVAMDHDFEVSFG